MKKVFFHTHPYEPFIDDNTEKLIVGTLPPPRFTTGDLKQGDVNFCYGSKDGQLWLILDKIFNLNLKFDTTDEAIEERKAFLKQRHIGICDIVASAEREKIDASDIGMHNITLRNVLDYLKQFPKVKTLLFTGGNSKNGPEYFFRKHLKEHSVSLVNVSDTAPRVHEFIHPATKKNIKTISLIAPSGAANRAVGSLESYKMMKRENPKFNTLDFRVLQYREFF
ncbi:uracil-DNA glycosylase family protein [uncultured Maribacter sp.]|uniref:uracil-DNA glycosylase family protein n=1 Tax=uncultured Maribacter sp. TaxID=431308 RepID=UPI0030ED1486|tara:strand:- start:17920 stop:18588 length:669 start_codon:yes stop_codon:yes gene_type:complete